MTGSHLLWCSQLYMTLEHDSRIPDWAQHEGWVDLAWINHILPAFTSATQIAYESLGRGATTT